MGNLPSDSATLAFTFSSTATTASRTWDIRATQYTCYDQNA